jgi:phage N-6-adenine-methyltransferase
MPIQMRVFSGAEVQSKREVQLKDAISQRWEAGKKDRLELGRDLYELREMLAGKGRDGEFAPWLRSQGIPRTLAYYYISLVTNQKCQDLTLLSENEGKPEADDWWQSTASPEWHTPKNIVELIHSCLGGVDLDPCSNSKLNPNVPATHLFTKDDDGLRFDWYGKVYMNPPYGREIGRWVEKLAYQYREGHTKEGLALVPARVDTDWFKSFRDFPACFIDGRLKFSGSDNSAPFPSAMFYLGIGCS